jgi:FKBP-type peptidyl-prolyl cis-trans isomerase
MKVSIITVLSALMFILVINGCESPGVTPDTSFETRIDSISYSLGFFYGQSLASEGVDSIQNGQFLAGLNQAIAEEESAIDQMAMQTTMQSFQQELAANRQARQQEAASGNIEEGTAFLEENAQNDDVMVTESGLQYRVIEEGSGDSPTAEDEVEVHYRGTLISGEEFDSSYSRDETASFPLNRVIPGWTEGLQLMSEGATYEFYVPADLAYGNNPPPGSIIEPGSVLIFEVELIDVKE